MGWLELLTACLNFFISPLIHYNGFTIFLFSPSLIQNTGTVLLDDQQQLLKMVVYCFVPAFRTKSFESAAYLTCNVNCHLKLGSHKITEMGLHHT